MLQLRTLGGVSVARDGVALTGSALQRRPLALLVQVAAAGERGVSRAKLVARLWPDREEEAARRILAQTLYALRRALGDDAAISGAEELRLDPAVVSSDVAEFAAALGRGELERAVACYGGPFLDGFYLSDAPAFERWAEGERARLAAEYRAALERLGAAASAQGDPERASAWWRKCAALDPLDARVALRVMESLAAAGDRSAAIQHARVYASLVQSELEAEPDPAVAELAERLKRESALHAGAGRPRRESGSGSGESGAPSAATATAGGPPPTGKLVESEPTTVTGSPPAGAESRSLLGDAGPPHGPPRASSGTRRSRAPRVALLAAATIAVIAASALAYRLRAPGRTPPNDVAGSAAAARDDAGPATLAVLPFRSLTAAGDIGFLGVGIPDAIITRLANVGRLRVRPTSAILPYEGRDVSTVEAGRALAARYLVSGTLQEVGGRLRVSVQLVRAADATPLWGERYDLPRADLLVLQDSVARRVADALSVQMTEGERSRVYRRYAGDAESYELLLRGRAGLARHTEPATRQAVLDFERAVARAPNDALAHAGLAMASAEMHLRFASGAEVAAWGKRAEEEAARALALDSTVAEVHQARAAVARKSEFDWERTIVESERALALSPSLELPHYFMAAAYYHIGLLDRAEREVRAAIEANPTGDRVEPLRTRGIVALLAGRPAEAVGLLEEVHRLSDRALADTYLAQAYYYSGDAARAESTLAALTRAPGSAATRARAQATLASLVAARGDTTRARALLRAVAAGPYVDHHVAYGVAAAHAQLGEHDAANAWLGRAVALGFPCRPWFARDTLLAPLRGDRAYQELMRALEARTAAAAARYGA